jgi:hypothetical protein
MRLLTTIILVMAITSIISVPQASALSYTQIPFYTADCSYFVSPFAYADLYVEQFNNTVQYNEHNANFFISFTPFDISSCNNNNIALPFYVQEVEDTAYFGHMYYYVDVSG